jgi:DNA-binding MarR family transcriptional regulator/ribosomal protein S18 acetylase RimI-like enzyme
MLLDQEVARMRAFNRFYTATIGVLGEGMHGTPYSLTEGRVLFELGQRDRTEVTDLRRTLGLDAGYLSRLLSRLEASGMTARARSLTDGRRQVAMLTAEGRAVFAILNERSSADARAVLDRIPAEHRARVLAAMGTIQGAFADPPAPTTVLIRPASAGDHGWVIQQHGIRYPAEHGWNAAVIEALTARIVADYLAGRDPRREACWIADLDGSPVGSVYCMRDATASEHRSEERARSGASAEPRNEYSDDDTARLRLLMVDPAARGHGIGGRLIEECLRFARDAGYRRMVLWTHEELTAARRLYAKAGFTLDRSETHEDFGKEVVSEHWSRDL